MNDMNEQYTPDIPVKRPPRSLFNLAHSGVNAEVESFPSNYTFKGYEPLPDVFETHRNYTVADALIAEGGCL